MVTHDGVATLCEDRRDAEEEAKDADMAWPHSGPHRAVQLVEASMAQEAQEPVAWQHRTRPTWGGNTSPHCGDGKPADSQANAKVQP